MASYASYKKVVTDQFDDNSITGAKLQAGAGNQACVKWIYADRGLQCQMCSAAGSCCAQSCGRCCLWTVPTNVSKLIFEIWSGGGGGAGQTCCNCCSFSGGGAGGNYAVRSISTTPGCQYTVCAGGSWPCNKSHTCSAGMGCRSYVNGHNLSNFCVTGGCGGWMCNGDAWGTYDRSYGCANCNICGIFGADFGMMGDTGMRFGNGYHHCRRRGQWTGAAPIIGKRSFQSASETWCVCGCYTNWPAGGGASGENSYYDNAHKCCAGGAQGGSGVVRITFM
jgi:hypothetical protein